MACTGGADSSGHAKSIELTAPGTHLDVKETQMRWPKTDFEIDFVKLMEPAYPQNRLKLKLIY